jgi:hypothetical protein
VQKRLGEQEGSSPHASKIDHGTMKQELEVSEKIEDFILRLIGKDVISWDKFVFIINKIILILMFFLLFKRGDFLTVITFFYPLIAIY